MADTEASRRTDVGCNCPHSRSWQPNHWKWKWGDLRSVWSRFEKVGLYMTGLLTRYVDHSGSPFMPTSNLRTLVVWTWNSYEFIIIHLSLSLSLSLFSEVSFHRTVFNVFFPLRQPASDRRAAKRPSFEASNSVEQRSPSWPRWFSPLGWMEEDAP